MKDSAKRGGQPASAGPPQAAGAPPGGSVGRASAKRGGQHSLRRRLLGFMMTAIVLAAAVQAATAWRSAVRQADEMFDYHLQQMAHALRGGLPLAPPALEADGSEEYQIQIWGADGVQLFRSAPVPLPPRAVLGFSDARMRGVHYRVYALQTPFQTIQIAQNLDARQARARALALRAVLPMAIMAPLLMLLAWWGISRSLAPLERTRADVARRAADDLAPLAGEGLPQEVRPLVDELNLLFGRLDQAFAAQKSFVANAAHELRSPLTALKLQVQALERAGDEAARGVAVLRLHQGIDRAIRLMQQLLVLARQQAEAPGSAAALPALALATLVRQAVTEALPQAGAVGVALGLDVEGDETQLPPVHGDAPALQILLRNLLDNALKHSLAQGRVDVVVAPGCVAVHDSGPGVPPEERERVFERFYRSADAPSGGSGLGLAIARTIAERHGAELSVGTSERLGGACFTLRFPPSAAAG
jgi:two-component system OmpR family sensor kinase